MSTQTLKNWHSEKIGNLGKVITGKTPPTAHAEYFNGDIPFITPSDIRTFDVRYITETDRSISNAWVSENKKYLLPKDSITFVCIGSTVGKIGMTKQESVTNQQINSIIPDENKLSNFFGYYLLRYVTPEIQQIASARGAGKGIMNKSQFEDFKVNIPDILTQRQIADVLSVYDDLIKNNTRRIKILEQMAQAIYREWFVNFRFPGHEKVKIVDSKTDFGKIPEGWGIKKLGDVVYNFDSKRRPISKMKRAQMRGEIPYYGAAKIIDYVNEVLLKGKYLLFAEDGSVITKEGYPVLQFVNEKFWVSNHAHILQGKEISTEHLYIVLSRLPIQGHITGAAQPKITQENMNRIPIPVPPEDIRMQFDDFIKSLFELRFNLQNSLNNLRQSRDLLLPKLVTGEIKV